MFLFYKTEVLLLPFVQLCKSPGNPWNFVESPGKVQEFDAKSSGKREKKSWKVLEFESFFLVGTMSLLKICFLSFIEDCHKSFDVSCNLFNYQSIHLYCCYCRY